MPLDALEVVLEIARPVAHGMAVLAHDVGLHLPVFRGAVLPIRTVPVRPGFTEIRVDLGDARVHAAVHVYVAVVMLKRSAFFDIPRALVMGEPLRIQCFHPLKRFFEPDAVGGLVAHRPEDHASTVLVAFHEALNAVENGRHEPRIVRDEAVPHELRALPFLHIRRFRAGLRQHGVGHTMRLDVGLVDHEEPELVEQIVVMRRVRVVAGAHAVHVVALHEQQIGSELLRRDRITGHRVAVVPVHAVDHNRPAIEQHGLVAAMSRRASGCVMLSPSLRIISV